MGSEGPFAPFPGDAGAAEEAGRSLARRGGALAAVGRTAARRGVHAGSVDSSGFYDGMVAATRPPSVDGGRLAVAGTVGEYAMGYWARAVRAYDREMRALNTEWAAAKASSFGVEGLELDRASMKPADIDDAVVKHQDAVASARDAVWAGLRRRQHHARQHLDAAADAAATILKRGPDALESALVGVGVGADVSVILEWPTLFGDATVEHEYPDSVMQGDPDAYWSTPEARAAQMRQWELDHYDPSEARAAVLDALGLIFADPRECVGDDASVDGCVIEGIGAIPTPWTKGFKYARRAEEAADAARDAKRAADDVAEDMRSTGEYADGLPNGTSGHVKMVPDEAQLREDFDELTRGGTPVEWSGYRGTVYEMPDGTIIGLRESSKSGGPTIDIKWPDGSKPTKIHINDS